MYAVIMTGGKQYRVQEGDRIKIERLAADEGASVDFDRVLMVGEGDDVKVGAPYVDGGKVSATVREHGRHSNGWHVAPDPGPIRVTCAGGVTTRCITRVKTVLLIQWGMLQVAGCPWQ